MLVGFGGTEYFAPPQMTAGPWIARLATGFSIGAFELHVRGSCSCMLERPVRFHQSARDPDTAR